MTVDPAPPAARNDPIDRTQLVTHVGAVAGLVGVLLAATTTIWPTLVLSLRMPEVGDFTRGSERRFWAWGRDVVSYTSHGLVLDDDLGPHPLPRLVLLVAVLLLAAVSLVGLLLRPGRRSELLGATCTALALGAVAASAVWRLSFDDRTAMLQPGVRAVTTAAGWCETVAAVLFVVALALLLGPQLFPRASGAAGSWVAESWRRVRELDDAPGSQVGFTDDLTHDTDDRTDHRTDDRTDDRGAERR
ncbi:hypothetical protein [Terrabacter terrigena]|uniref:TIGR02234 family membrane protein n=1 Tax=Terrabacter terrigena TaxID=574718 RepID=A0ABW3N3L8_9MICO